MYLNYDFVDGYDELGTKLDEIDSVLRLIKNAAEQCADDIHYDLDDGASYSESVGASTLDNILNTLTELHNSIDSRYT